MTPILDPGCGGFDSGLDGETDAGQDVYNHSPTPHASQAARLPPQSAQPVPEGNMTESSDNFSVVFESLKKQPAGEPTSSDPFEIPDHHERPSQKHQRAMATGDRPVGEKRSPAEGTTPRPRMAAEKSLANSKVKMAALEMEGKTETRKSEILEHREYDYSLPASNSSSPATSPAKKKPTAKKPAVKKPAPKAKTNAKEVKTATGSRARNTQPAPAPPVHQSSEAHSDEEDNGDTVLAGEASTVTQSPYEDQKEGVVMASSDSTTSFPESDNADDEDFECSRKMTPSNTRRRTRAVAAESVAAKEAERKAANQPAAAASVHHYDDEDKRANVDAAEKPKKQSKQPSKKPAVEKAQANAPRTEPKVESTKETNSSAEKSMKKGPTSQRAGAANRTSSGTNETKQQTVASSKGDRVRRGEANKLQQSSESIKQAKEYDRKPNIVAFGPGGPKKNGRSQKTTAATDSRSSRNHPSPNNAEHPAATKSQLSKGVQKAQKKQLNTARDGDSPMNDFIGHVEGDCSRAARSNQSTVAGAIPDNSPISKADNNSSVSRLDTEMTTLNYKNEGGDVYDQFVAGDAEADMGAEVTAHLMVDSLGHQDQDMTNVFEEEDIVEKVFNPLAQADIGHLHGREQRTVLGEIDANYRTIPKGVPADMPRPMKRKLPITMTVEERSPIPQALPLKTGSQKESVPTARMNSTALNIPSDGVARPVKKPRYNSAYEARYNEDASYGRHLSGGPGSLHRGIGSDAVNDVFGPGKTGEHPGPSAFVQRLISNESADRGPGKTGRVAPGSSDTRASPRQHPSAISHPATVRSAVPGAAFRPQGNQQLDDVGKRMLAALGPEKPQSPGPWSPGDDLSKSLLVGGPTESSPSDAFDQRNVSGLDERTRAWKKATEPYADSLGETMHKIINVSRSLHRHGLLVYL